MSNRPPSRASRLSRRLTPDQQFWQLWRGGTRPDLPAFLAARPGLGSADAAAVVAIDQYERWLGGERVPAEDYLRLLPADAQGVQAQCDVVYGEYLLREQLGEHPQLEEYRRRFPTVGDLLARQIELHHALAESDVGASGAPSANPASSAPDEGVPAAGEAAPPDVPGYVLGEVIGRGGMGVVYKASQVSLNRDVALKVLPVRPGSDPAVLERMRREAQVTARMSHPNIVTVFDAGPLPGWFYLAMEYVAGIDLHRLVDQFGPLPIAWACDYVRQAALGLQHAHEHGLVHRDVKPSNLIVSPVPGTREGPPGTVKLLDLGLARISAEDDAGRPPITQVGAFMGTPDFMAPEQANDPRQADTRSDLYSLGCTFFFLLTGRPPFTGATPLAKLMQHHAQEAPAVEQVRSDVPAVVAAVVARLLAKRPERRYQSPAELCEALAAFQPRPPSTMVAPRPPRLATPLRARLAHTLVGHEDWVKGIAFSGDGAGLASGSLDGSVCLWDPETGVAAWKVKNHTAGVLCVAYSDDGRWVATQGQDRVLCLADAATGVARWKVPGHERNVDRLRFVLGGAGLLSGGHDGMLRLRDAASGGLRRDWLAHSGPVWGLAVLPDGETVLSGGQDRALRLWNVASGEAVGFLPEQPLPVTSVEVSADGRHALTGGLDGQVHLWDLPGLRLIRTFVGHPARVTDVALSPDGTMAVSASRDQTLRLWDMTGGSPGEVLTGHTAWVTSVAWSRDGRLIASAGVDRRVCLWHVAEGEPSSA